MSELLLLTALFLVFLIGLYAIGVPVAFALGVSSLLIMVVPFGVNPNLGVVSQRMFSGINSFILIAVPFFLMGGRVMNSSGMADDIFNFAEELVKPVRGGVAQVNVIVSVIFSGMSGSAIADAAGLGVIEYKSMVDRGYDKRFSVGVTGASATIGPIIPPSIPMILYGVLAEASIGKLFIAGIIPGFLLSFFLMVTVYLLSIKYNYSPVSESGWNLTNLIATTIRAVPAFIAPVLIIGGIMSGLFTPTEASVVLTIYALFIAGVVYRNLDYKTTFDLTKETFIDSTVLIFIIGVANLYSFMVTLSGIPSFLIGSITALSNNSTILIALLALVIMVLGTFLSLTAIIFLLVPIILPLFGQTGIDPVHFGIVFMLTGMLGLLTPPFGPILFALERVTDLDLIDIIRGVLPFYIPLLLIIILVILFDPISLYLPEALGL
jgi:tripartite ATP-independent transporter DctM subunit